MRRKDKEITDRDVIDSIILNSRVCRLAMVDGDCPYVVPLSFGYSNNTLYFHSAPEGKKIRCIENNCNVCVEFDIDAKPIPADTACKWSMRYRSAVAVGRAHLVHNPMEKHKALTVIAQHYGHQRDDVSPAAVKSLSIIKVTIDSVTGKISGFS